MHDRRPRVTSARAPLAAVVLVAMAGLTAAACGSDKNNNDASSSTTVASGATTTTTAAAAAPVATNAITAKDFAFDPKAITVKAGTTVTWKNGDTTSHAIADDKAAFNGPLDPGTPFSHAYSSPGTFGYHCSIHPSMTGTVTVTA